MNKIPGLEQDKGVQQQATSRWIGVLTSAPPVNLHKFDCQLVAGEGRSKKLFLRHEIDSAAPLCAERAGCGVIFDGALYNRRDLERELGDLLTLPASNDAEIILVAYERWGEELLKRLRGAFALLIWDSSREVLLCLRDPIGTYPMFYAEDHDGLLVSPSIDVLVGQPNISGSLNRAALADYLIDRFPRMEETFFDAVSRVPPGHVLRVARDDRHSYRYWDPAPGDKVDWLTPDEVERFDELLDQAVSRCLSQGPAGIFLSGGLDSVSVAAVAAHRAAADGITTPWALSLVFPETDVNEEVVQRGVAAQLGLPQVLKRFYDATGANGLLAGAVGLNSSLSAPINNTWLPAYHALVREGKARGCRTILTGSGGDEWLTVSPMLAADLLRDFDLAGVFRLWQTARRSFRRSNFALLRALVWTFGLGPLVIPPVHKFVKRLAPSLVKARRRIFAPLPKWLAPDPTLRRELEHRWEERSLREAYTSDSLYLREAKTGLDHPLVSWEIEELFNFGQMAGVRVLHPIWDPDLVDLLYRTPPFLLIRNGRNKGLVRDSLRRRFPDLGFEHQRKVEATRFYSSLIYGDASNIWKQLGGGRELGSMGVVDERALDSGFDQLLARRKIGEAHLAWSILNLESWARAHAS
jgi:asparagine synthase (glutamine-hydrolysing)